MNNKTITISPINNKKQFENLFFTYYQDLCNYAFSFVNDKMLAEDIVQSFFKELWEKREKIKIQSGIKSYFYKAIKNDCLDFLKSKFAQTNFTPIDVNTDIESDNSFDFTSDEEELLKQVKSAINKLPAQCKTIFTLSRMANMTHKEIASELDLSTKTIENQISIAIKKIKEKLKP